MPQRRSSYKELRKNKARHAHNLFVKNAVKKTVKKYLKSVREKNKTEAQTNLKLIYKSLDKAAKRQLIHKNTASRRKSRLVKLLNNLA